jgi:hypothetical protein
MIATATKRAQPLIESDNEFFEKTGLLPMQYDDVRRFPRYYFRFCFTAHIYPPRGEGEPTSHLILSRDLSRSGVSLVHTEQLFPGQRLVIDLHDSVRHAEVQWCRRSGPQKYVVGCRFVKES